jgi:hypothetical protein
MPIELIANDDNEFDDGFLEQLPGVEQAMIARNMDPSTFAFTKTLRLTHSDGTRENDYTIAISDDSFSVAYPSDIGFLEYFLARFVTADEAIDPPGVGPTPRSRKYKRPVAGMFARALSRNASQ